jgi:hypothetical protein
MFIFSKLHGVEPAGSAAMPEQEMRAIKAPTLIV